ncbi:MAG TPA: XdhC/CoxI family protein [Spirochaetota bacterium]|nr:XdhC/CoxI family protein [Spirochaetota bacterium]HPN82198.1 XdhC/CoxI family protein [Spirochaetota bacterium]
MTNQPTGDTLGELVRLRSEGIESMLVTVIAKEGHGPAIVQSKMLVAREGRVCGTVGGGAIEHMAITKAQALLGEMRGGVVERYDLTAEEHAIIPDATKTGMVCGGSVTLFYEYHGGGEQLVIFGAGHIGRAFSRILPGMGYRLTVVDSRPEYIETFEGAALAVCHDYGQSFSGLSIPENAWIVIATHSHALDYQVLEQVFRAGWKTRYVGVVASRSKRDRFFGDLAKAVPDADTSRVFMPCGLNIGGTLPEEIVISILAEMQSVRYGKGGQAHMKDRK